MKWKKRLLKTIVAACLFALIWMVETGWNIVAFGSRDFAKPADCAIVLGAAIEGASPSPVFEERIKHAISLHRAGTVKLLIFTGGTGTGKTNSEAAVARDYAVAHGVPPSEILTESESRSTKENLARAQDLMRIHNLHSAVIVSDPLHLKRAALIASRLNIEAVTSPTPTSRYQTFSSRFPFLIREIYFYNRYLIFSL